jgi:hypothetical protein
VTDAELVRHKALELLLLIRSGIFDPHLEQVLAGVLARMRDPGYDPPARLPGDGWPSGPFFDDHGG